MEKFGWSRVAILQQAEEVFISVSILILCLISNIFITFVSLDEMGMSLNVGVI